MILERLELSNFRNYRHQEIEFSPEKNIITGRNAQGKSNLLEAFYFLSHLKSNRSPRMRDLVMDGEEKASVLGVIMDGEARVNVRVSFGRKGKSVEVNGQKVDSGSRARGLIKCVMFAPEDLLMIKGDPARRREFLDETMEGLGPIKAKQVLHYKHVLRQRNAVIRSWEEHGDRLGTALEPWDDALAKAGSVIALERTRVVRQMEREAAEAYAEITGEVRAVSIKYRGTFEVPDGSAEEVESEMRRAIRESAGEERRTRSTVVGPHRDDVEIRLGGLEARFSASQGEQRTIAFSMRLAQRRYLERETGKTPILLLDDVLSELDSARRTGVLRVAGAGSQAVITATEIPGDLVVSGTRVFMVEQGIVIGV